MGQGCGWLLATKPVLTHQPATKATLRQAACPPIHKPPLKLQIAINTQIAHHVTAPDGAGLPQPPLSAAARSWKLSSAIWRPRNFLSSSSPSCPAQPATT